MSVKKFPSEFQSLLNITGNELVPVGSNGVELQKVSLEKIRAFCQTALPVIPTTAESITLSATPTVITSNTATDVKVNNTTTGAILQLPVLSADKSIMFYASESAVAFKIQVLDGNADVVSAYDVQANDVYSALFTDGEWAVVKINPKASSVKVLNTKLELLSNINDDYFGFQIFIPTGSSQTFSGNILSVFIYKNSNSPRKSQMCVDFSYTGSGSYTGTSYYCTIYLQSGHGLTVGNEYQIEIAYL